MKLILTILIIWMQNEIGTHSFTLAPISSRRSRELVEDSVSCHFSDLCPYVFLSSKFL
jgi:hypothetical protein